MNIVRSWGRLNAHPHLTSTPRDPQELLRTIAHASQPGLAHGLGRSYGDVGLNPGGELWFTHGLNHFIHFDESSGRLVCEAGVLLMDIQEFAYPRGWRLPVTPGTQWITVGGAIANDVHGKNHHEQGTFGEHVRRIGLARTDGQWLECGPDRLPEWFAATVGGLGLTGVIVQVELQLHRTPGPWLDTETCPHADLDEFFALADSSEQDWEHTVSWIDCLASDSGRGLFMRSRVAADQQGATPNPREHALSFVPPVSLVNRLTLRPFNLAYGQLKRWPRRSRCHYGSHLYPLDHIGHWNRLYGPRGFYQYQCALPVATQQDALRALLRTIAGCGQGSFLAVLKTFGHRRSPGLLSFPMAGATLALDFPNRGGATLRLFERLDAIVAEAGGRLYAAKDARMPRALFRAGYPLLPQFLPFRDPGLRSALSQRLLDH
ncbi:FAD-binding oxidoreductase [Pseudoxanthomonas indica]|uniref:FAD/FMN-containing dehydrogenase n=1 Tax=Pseudoxanthomonas indica TaxID=428993 RepID=A0A1T5LWT9_9GAMM|nr:FAD-binding oxidoreductase [Pseudoxanthomonas indica]GGD41417.1 FAD-linked oxidase [Pseudoxanthomonas indica]SKC80466.1 FAD/FMN-containing dehydrogenase [Pseudoxanthomonas indica]